MVLRIAILAVVGAGLGAAANHLIHRWCLFNPRPIGPWGVLHPAATRRTALDRVPILGWLGMSRESELHGKGFWVRPMLIELAMAVAVPGLYWFESQTGLLLPGAFRNPASLAQFEPWGTQIFFGHLLLLTLMVAATFIDFDEQTIPDIITIPGTLLALTLASCSLFWFLPTATFNAAANRVLWYPTTFEIPIPPPDAKWFSAQGLWTGLAIWTLWCFALADRRLILRRGLRKAVEFFFAGLVRYPTWKPLLVMWIVGLIAVRIVWGIGGDAWHGLLSSLVGLAVGGGIVWAIRIVASLAMRVEAMGFGDVTLMAMIGAFLGWQASVIAFFLAPMAAIAIVLVYFIITRESRVPFGPYLCAGALLTIFFWDQVSTHWLMPNLALMGPVLLWLGLSIVGLMGVMLFVWRLIKISLFR
ncbi:Type IV leader peptidase family protein [Stieleria varia]|uniref:Type IV leader peptidase family protein n=2 Tax=Stieleria varia TaxID=2528005 RepID=A0A5C6B0T4_9BACT|nr:Type IV leader peptidase family protein [Stieleria varia]